jgi:hypothetical protein
MWTVNFYTGTDWPLIKNDHGIELECAGATREQAQKITAVLNKHFQENNVKSREVALAELLLPIRWHMSSPVRARQNLVMERHKAVASAYPFFDDKERELADAWIASECHSGLWD